MLQLLYVKTLLLLILLSAGLKVASQGLATFYRQIPLQGPLPAAGQANNKMLWYQGKKINNHTIITTKGTVVQYDKQKSQITVQLAPGKDKMVRRVINELNQSSKRKQQLRMVVSKRKSGVMMVPVINKVSKEQDLQEAGYQELVNNTIQLPALADKSFKVENSNSIPDSIAAVALQMEALVKQLQQDVQYAQPPGMEELHCLQCDTVTSTKYYEKEKLFIDQFFAIESEISRNTLLLCRRIDLFLEEVPSASNNKQLTAMKDRASVIQDLVQEKLEKKLSELVKTYGKDLFRAQLLIKLILMYNRLVQLSTGDDNEMQFIDLINKLMPTLTSAEKYLDEQMDKKNYGPVMNGLALVIGIERQRQLLGIGESENDDEYVNVLTRLMDKITAFNRFRLQMEIEYEGEWYPCTTANENFFAVNKDDLFMAMAPVDCKYRFFIAEEHVKDAKGYHFAKRFNLALEITDGITRRIKSDDDGNCYTESVSLTGLKVRPFAPFITVDFCEGSTSDSLAVDYLHLPMSRENRDDERYGLWHFSAFDRYMQHDGYRDRQPSEEIYFALERTKQPYERFQINPVVNPDSAQMEQHYYEAIDRENALKTAMADETGHPGAVIFDAKNGEEIILHSTVIKTYTGLGDQAEDDGKATVKIKVKLTHDPLPYKKPVK